MNFRLGHYAGDVGDKRASVEEVMYAICVQAWKSIVRDMRASMEK